MSIFYETDNIIFIKEESKKYTDKFERGKR